MNRKYRIAVIRYHHETCTFCPGGDTDVQDWLKIKPVLEGDEVLYAGPPGDYVDGFVRMAEEFGDIEPVGIASPYEVYGGISRSWNTRNSFEYFMQRILDDLKKKSPVDAVYLSLHGAMAVRDIPRPEAEIAKRIRKVVGKRVPIAATFDLHGNEDEEFLKWADGAFAVKRYPHYDTYGQGERAARFLRRLLKNDYTPVHVTRKPPVITATVLQWTGEYPAMNIMERARQWEDAKRDVIVNVFFGYPWADSVDGGMTVQVVANNDLPLAGMIAGDMADYIWRVREDLAGKTFPRPKEAVRMAEASIKKGEKPVILADYSDRSGDATWILKELAEQKISHFLMAPLRDEKTINIMVDKHMKPGDKVDMMIGASTGTKQAGEPVRISGVLRFLGPKYSFENVAVVETEQKSMIIIVPAYKEFRYPEEIDMGFIEPKTFNVIVLKSRVHFRRGFIDSGFARNVIIVDAPGPWLGTIHLDHLDYKFTPIDKLYPFMKSS